MLLLSLWLLWLRCFVSVALCHFFRMCVIVSSDCQFGICFFALPDCVCSFAFAVSPCRSRMPSRSALFISAGTSRIIRRFLKQPATQSQVQMGISQIRGTSVVVPKVRIVVFWGLGWGPPIKYQLTRMHNNGQAPGSWPFREPSTPETKPWYQYEYNSESRV